MRNCIILEIQREIQVSTRKLVPDQLCRFINRSRGQFPILLCFVVLWSIFSQHRDQNFVSKLPSVFLNYFFNLFRFMLNLSRCIYRTTFPVFSVEEYVFILLSYNCICFSSKNIYTVLEYLWRSHSRTFSQFHILYALILNLISFIMIKTCIKVYFLSSM
jgi:hypothetical protein